MIDMTPLDVRNKRGDFKRILRGYDPQEVDVFLELVAERLEALVMENLQYRERSENLQAQVASQSGRERAVQEALVTAQELRTDIRDQAQREAELTLAEARTEARRLVAEAEAEVRTMVRDAERRLEQGQDALAEMERRRLRFLKEFRQLLEREMDVVEVEEARVPLEDRPIELNLGGGRARADEGAEGPQETDDAAAEAAADEAGPEELLSGADAGAEAAVGDPDVEGVSAGEADEAAQEPLDAEPVPGDEDDEASASGAEGGSWDADTSWEADEGEEAAAGVAAEDEGAGGAPLGHGEPDVDGSAAEHPPLDAPVDELAAAYAAEEDGGDSDGPTAEVGDEADDETLYLSLDEGAVDDEDTRWG